MDEVKKLLHEAFSAAVLNGVLVEDVNFEFTVLKLIGDKDKVILNEINLRSRFTKDNP